MKVIDLLNLINEETSVPKFGSEQEFMDYHRTGFIDGDSYNDNTYYGSDIERSPELVKTYGDIEFRKNGKALKYVKKGEDGMPVRGEDGMATYLSDEEIEERGLPKAEKTITAYKDGEPVGFAGDSFGAIEVMVRPEYQKKGIGSELLADFMRENPDMKIGQMTDAGMGMSKSAYRKLNQS